MIDAQQRAAAKAFAKNWKDRGYEKGDSQIFWVELLTTVFGVTEISQFISFEDQVHLDHTSFIDGYIEKTHVMIEQKSINKSLTAAIRQSDGSMLTPFEQAKRYSSELPYSKRPRWIVTSNFQSFYIYDMEKPGGDPEIIQLENLEKGREVLFDKAYLFLDTNFATMDESEQEEFLKLYCTTLNSLGVDFKITVMNNNQNMDRIREEIFCHNETGRYQELVQSLNKHIAQSMQNLSLIHI